MSLPFAAMYYQYESKKKGSKVGGQTVTKLAWNVCSILLPCVQFFIIVFFSTINKEHRKTFWSLKRGKDVTLSYFESNEDSTKAVIFHHNYRHWKEIEDKVEKWVRENWKRWMEEEPEWLDDNMRARIPPHMIPSIEDRKKVEAMQNERRRSSLMGSIALQSRRYSIGGVNKVMPEKEMSES